MSKHMEIGFVIKRLRAITHSIAFYPALIACFFVVLSYLMINLDYSDTGKEIKTHWDGLKLRDASTARTIISVIAAGILSLAVFSFTMVMVVLNQAASQMSNRVVDKLIGNRFQQIVLGIYIGTIVYSFFLLSAIRDIDKGIYVPSLSTYLLIFLAVINIFLFIYFLHYITQSIKYHVIINRIRKQTAVELKNSCFLSAEQKITEPQGGYLLHNDKAGIFVGFNKKSLIDLATELDAVISFHHPVGTFLLPDTPYVTVNSNKGLDPGKIKTSVLAHMYIENENSITSNYYHGLRQLTEIAIKALSPGINDPGTAIESLRSIAELLSYRLCFYPENMLHDENHKLRLVTIEKKYDELVKESLLPIWDYGKNDRLLRHEMQYLLERLLAQKHDDVTAALLHKVKLQTVSE